MNSPLRPERVDPGERNARWRDLVLAARSSPDGFIALYDEASPWLLRMVRRLVGPEHAEDVLAEVFLQAWRELGRFDPDRAPVPVWLSVIAHSRALDHLRRCRRADPARLAGQLASASAVPEDPAALVGRAQELRLLDLHCERLLSRSEREVLGLAYFEELSQAEISARLGMPLGTVKTRMNRAHRKLRLAWSAPAGGAALPLQQGTQAGVPALGSGVDHA